MTVEVVGRVDRIVPHVADLLEDVAMAVGVEAVQVEVLDVGEEMIVGKVEEEASQHFKPDATATQPSNKILKMRARPPPKPREVEPALELANSNSASPQSECTDKPITLPEDQKTNSNSNNNRENIIVPTAPTTAEDRPSPTLPKMSSAPRRRGMSHPNSHRGFPSSLHERDWGRRFTMRRIW